MHFGVDLWAVLRISLESAYFPATPRLRLQGRVTYFWVGFAVECQPLPRLYLRRQTPLLTRRATRTTSADPEFSGWPFRFNPLCCCGETAPMSNPRCGRSARHRRSASVVCSSFFLFFFTNFSQTALRLMVQAHSPDLG